MVVVASAQSPAAGAPKVLLLPSKPTAAAGAPAGRNMPLMLPAGQRGASPEAESGGPTQARKRQRLTHLSPEEKALRRWARDPGLGPDPTLGQGSGSGSRRARAPLAGPVRCQRGAGRDRKSGVRGSTTLS